MSPPPDGRILVPETTDQFLWIVIVGVFGSFIAAFGIGANDVANAFATSVGSKAVTLRQAIVLAGIFEFLGALLLGTHVTKAIRESIADDECFADNPGILMYGMMCVLYTTGSWLILASYLELPVSTTHSTIGSIVGMVVAYGGTDCVVWMQSTDEFPYMEGMVAIVASWVISPVFSGIVSFLLFLTVRTYILRSPRAFERSFWVYPILVMFTIAVNVFFFVYKGAQSLDLHKTSATTAATWALGLGGGFALLVIPTALPIMKKNVIRIYNEDGTLKVQQPVQPKIRSDARGGGIGAYINRHLDYDVHASAKESEYVANIHDRAEKFDPRAEEVFKYVQVVTAVCDSFAHGANNVANAIGPLETIYIIYIDGFIDEGRDLGGPGFLILALGGIGIVLGLALFGYKIISAIGVKIAKITPSRGFSIELGAAVMVIIGTRLRLPLSTTHCQVGATAGVALLEGAGGLNSRVIIRTLIGWLVTVVICGFSCALLFSQGAYAPNAFDKLDPEVLADLKDSE